MRERNNLQEELDEALKECSRLRDENKYLRSQLELDNPFDGQQSLPEPTQKAITSSSVNNGSTNEAKIALFRNLFCGREDVYPVRWLSKAGKAGYSPACRHEWNRAFCDKPRIKCGQCDNRAFLPVTDTTIFDHLTGKHVLGVYPLLKDDTCWFLAADFDKKSWQDDAAYFLETCKKLSVPAVLERSRSGNGGHVWIFFQGPISATLARKLGCTILTKTMEKRCQVGLDSYDRLFPNQDTLPKGGFGNLIALPLQKQSREAGNSLFVDENFQHSLTNGSFWQVLKK